MFHLLLSAALTAPTNPESIAESATGLEVDADLSNLDQVTSVSQLTEVQPSDWAFQALQLLVERYGCIAGYSNKTFRGNRAISRYEFAAGLNGCLNKPQELITAATADSSNREDFLTLQKLQEEFAVELATLRGSVDVLEVRTAQLEAQRFSSTTILRGQVVFGISTAAGGKPPGLGETNTVFTDLFRGAICYELDFLLPIFMEKGLAG
jgi:hypothetical protein